MAYRATESSTEDITEGNVACEATAGSAQSQPGSAAVVGTAAAAAAAAATAARAPAADAPAAARIVELEPPPSGAEGFHPVARDYPRLHALRTAPDPEVLMVRHFLPASLPLPLP